MKKYLLPLIFILLLIFSLAGDCDWLAGYDQRIKLTIDNTKIDSALSWFPVAVHFTAAQGEEIFSEFDADGDYMKCAFTKADGVTQLYAEKELFDVSESDVWYHVSRDAWAIASGADTDFYYYYDNDAADNTDHIGAINTTAGGHVWDANFSAVYHMVDATTSTVVDSTSNNNDGTKKAANEPIEVAGKVHKGQDFDDSGGAHSEYIDCGDFLDSAANFTFEAILNPGTCDSDDDILTKGRHGASYPLVIWRDEAVTDHLGVLITDDNGDYSGAIYSNYDFGSTGYVHTAVTFQGGSATGLKAYFNGAEDTGGDFPADMSLIQQVKSSADTIVIGDDGTGSTTNKVFNGIIDEVRISTSVRTAAWLKATYNSLWDTLLTYGSEETSGNAIMFGMNF